MRLTTNKLILATAIFLVLFDNVTFFQNVIGVYPFAEGKNLFFVVSLAFGLTGVLALFMSLLASRFTTKPLLIALLFMAAGSSYFANNYSVIIDYIMVQNILQTNVREATDLFSLKLFLYIFFLGIVPALLVWLAPLEPQSWRQAAVSRLKLITIALLLILIPLFLFSRFYASFFREHEELRFYSNPTYALFSVYKYAKRNFATSAVTVEPIGTDANNLATDRERELIILVVGEAARADRFSLNGYERPTNPLLSQEEVIFYPQVSSCDTSTATAVPCMFSDLTRAGFSNKKAAARENILDVVQRAGVNVLWRDNNSDSKGVALRVPYEDYQDPARNTICDVECRDEGMLVGLQEYIDAQKSGDILIVLHQMGNHGPAYYKRYPKEFARFTPTCQTNQLDECSPEEIGNAYDNAILYTDYFLSKTIALLKQNDKQFETAMIYMSDHGESLGEFGVYLHGLPYLLAPETQKHIAAIMWFGAGFAVDRQILRQQAGRELSQDNLFHTLLGSMEIHTELYNPKLDILCDAHQCPPLQAGPYAKDKGEKQGVVRSGRK
ncbi:phosphoethanolamine transferase [Thiovibrio frasassiensis]|uniref:Phosphoethanolamine--lipid A transferase n=1 Tax=Thiovibrio frasassiensis TaxID=2984131 RepID=A0A9X4MGD0_9BACT|nr:phosphoethanolamine--lipid A transferase [Thiovibrio frasassiensis]MDG4475033.1 phosphoethanolamine--lipid A transferase [Thiovibrio frasassiensis]